jgi:hypothetical protein
VLIKPSIKANNPSIKPNNISNLEDNTFAQISSSAIPDGTVELLAGNLNALGS